jgi:photosystem II stability/assembly factor-like uncharacterized protein
MPTGIKGGFMNFRKAAQIVLFLLVALFIAAPQPAGAGPLDTWRSRNPLPLLNAHLNGIACNTTTAVAVGVGGRIITSSDGFNWTTRNSKTTDILYGAAYGNGKWVAVGEHGTIVKSTNAGVTWTVSNQGYSDADELHAVAFGNGKFVAVGKTGRILTSPDANTWTYQVSGTGSFLNGVAFGNGTFVAVGTPPGASHPVILKSTNGASWLPVRSTSTESYKSVTYGNGDFVAVGYNSVGSVASMNIVVSSDKGLTWGQRNSTDTNWIDGVAYGADGANSTFVAVDNQGNVLTSPDTNAWTKWYMGSTGYGSNILNGITYFNKTFITVGNDCKLLTSPDGASWTERPSAENNFFNAVVFAESKYVAVGWGGKILTSTDTRQWVERDSKTPDALYGVAYGEGTFVAVGAKGKIVSSVDGISWVARTSGYTGPLFGVCYGNGTFVAVGSRGKVLTSPDGTTWTSRASGTTNSLFGVTFGNGFFMAVGQDGKILTSASPGTTWTNRTPEISQTCLYAVTFGGDTFVAVGETGTILTAPKAAAGSLTWTKRNTGINNAFRAAAHVGSTFVALGSGGKIFTSDSVDASSWTSRNSNIIYTLLGIAAKPDGTMVVVGAFATILSSPYDLEDPWIIRSTGTYKKLMAIARGTVGGQVKFIAVGEGATVLTSGNGSTWDIKTITTSNYLYGITYGAGQFVAVGSDTSGKAGVFTSSDGDTWVWQTFGFPPGWTWQIPLPGGTALNGIIYGNGVFIAGGEEGIIVRKADSDPHWYYYLLETCFDSKSVAYGQNTFVMVGNYTPYTRTILFSTDGVYWTMSYAPYIPQSPTTGFAAVAFGSNRFIVVGPSVKIVRSRTTKPSFAWKQQPLVDFTGSFDFNGISYGGGTIFAAVGTLGQLLTTPDGITWTFRTSGTSKTLYGIAYGVNTNGKTFIAVGQDGIILQSGSMS